ncbi:glycoside hydrolase family 43 protein [Filimonas effusa]|uniref:Carbohydrate-binding protein n=1 Tax=Filimonas effusa TaxID=2508721 RepID=A0A4V1MAD9_9BACT|nr:glycoside hydrolase family 43 protein [Filimonas effusa]RXK85536.1 carbohydrate-binding protein [Filimonas effusa]
MKQKLATIIAATLLCGTANSQNPIIQTKFTADPAPMVYKDTVFLYTSHDEDDAPPGQGRFLMRDWLCYTSTDMVNWTDHGPVASLRNFKWADKAITGWGGFDNGAWAPQTIERDGKFYLYCPVQGRGIGVLVADNPRGPFVDPLGHPLIGDKYDSIDPTVFIDDDGQAYLYWGNPNLWYVKLNKDMISLAGPIIKDSSFAKIKDQKDPFHYQEGPWAYKRNGKYYMAYASTCCPEGIGYAMSNSPAGPWEFKGYIMKPNGKSTGNHPGIIDYKGKSYVFGFNFRINFMLTEKHHERRSVCVEEFSYNPDGTIPELPWWREEGIRQIGTLDPYKLTEAETIAWSAGLKTNKDSSTGNVYVTDINNGDYLIIKGADLKKGPASFKARVAPKAGGNIEIRLDSLQGQLLGTCRIDKGFPPQWINVKSKLARQKGVHDIVLVFKGGEGELFDFDWWQMIN